MLTLPAEVQDYLLTQCTNFVMLGSKSLPIAITTPRCAFDNALEKARGIPDLMAVVLAENDDEVEEAMRKAADRDPGDDDVPDDPHAEEDEEF